MLAALGVFIRQSFVPAQICASWRLAIESAPAELAQVYTRDGVTADVQQDVRRALSVNLARDAAAPIERALDDLRGEVSAHFREPLASREPPHYLVYGPGAFFAPHRDRPRVATTAPEAAARKVSVVLFVNGPRDIDPDGYVGGALNFYGLIDDPRCRDIGLGCDAAPGLLVAFRSDTLHEVTPVVEGRRVTVVTWFA